ncbi:hypothetical protein KSX_77440 [Ktedonospora formicarum]|uniref:Uncharacterized protein n=1 Tax=Ktedonospora formicarum TaxID=2778364 RepID=A0A8J3I6J2_9CHLR|nr:hypothetical protein KSX_77440 [Ktedonospora formicarum]
MDYLHINVKGDTSHMSLQQYLNIVALVVSFLIGNLAGIIERSKRRRLLV